MLRANIDSDSVTDYNGRMSDESLSLTIDELARAADVPVRTIRYYVAEGLVPGPGTRGKGTTYGDEHLARLRLIRLLTERHVPLAEVRRLVEPLSPEETRTLLGEEERRDQTLSPETAADSPKAYISGLLERARAARAADDVPHFRSPPRSPYSMQRAPAPARSEAPRSLGAWERWELAPGVELQVQGPLDERRRRLVEHLMRLAREEMREESS